MLNEFGVIVYRKLPLDISYFLAVYIWAYTESPVISID